MSLTKDLIYFVEVRKNPEQNKAEKEGEKEHHLIRILEYKKIAFKVKNIVHCKGIEQ